MTVKEFTKKYYVDRRNTNCVKWDIVDKDTLPMFIADMDFKTDEHIIEGLKNRIEHGAYGYSFAPKDYADVLIAWNKRRHNVDYKAEWIRYSPGAVDGLIQCLYAFTKEGDPVLITTPVYPPFAGSIKRTKRKVVRSPLKETDGYFTFDYKDIEKRFKKYGVKMMILCSPHNPIGRVWKKGELEELFDLCKKYNVLVISDEVHGDLIMPDQEFIPSLAFKKHQDHIISLIALSKTFSLAIFFHCHVLIPNRKLRKIFDQYQFETHKGDPNQFSLLASYYGYQYGDEWLDGLNEVVYDNYHYMVKRLKKYVRFLPLEGTYLLFGDFSKVTDHAGTFLKDKCQIRVNAGETFGKGYETYARINLATSHANIKKACDRIISAIEQE